ncbi:hypothetical protein BH11ARM2_BH11ARM2_25440 [soil metagenome]
MNRLFNWIRGLFHKTMDKLEDPDMMLDQAKRDMQGALIANREKAVQAITQKNRLAIMLEDEKKKAETLENQAAMALKRGDRELATGLMRQKMTHDATIVTLQQSYEQAVTTVEQVKVAIRRQDDEVRKKTAEALAMKAQWKQAQIQNSISKALEGLTFENQFEGFGAAQDRIREAQSEASARQEMQGTSLQGRIMAMEDTTRDMEAESELEKLEQRLGLKPASPLTAEEHPIAISGSTVPPAPSQSEAEQALADLEKRLNQGA